MDERMINNQSTRGNKTNWTFKLITAIAQDGVTLELKQQREKSF
jgi:hypothetical protein